MAERVERIKQYERGLIIGGACFIMPAMLIVLLLAWVYLTGNPPSLLLLR